MTIDKDLAMKLWSDIFGKDTLWAQDCFGTWMYRDDYGDHEKTRNNRPGGNGKYYTYGWDVDHIKPKSKFKNENDANFYNNLEPLQFINNQTKSDLLEFEINKRKYKVVVCDICKLHGKNGYGILDIASNKRVDWKYTKNLYYL